MTRILILLLAISTPAFALSRGEVKRSYEACLDFLKRSPEEQRAIVKRTRYSMKQIMWGCKFQARRSLKEMQANEREYQRQLREGSSQVNPGWNTGSDPAPKSRDVYGGYRTCPDGSRGTTCELSPDGTYHGPNLCPNGQYGTTCRICPDGSYGC